MKSVATVLLVYVKGKTLGRCLARASMSAHKCAHPSKNRGKQCTSSSSAYQEAGRHSTQVLTAAAEKLHHNRRRSTCHALLSATAPPTTRAPQRLAQVP